jgi:AbrB family looped-hinge helix DNA binding protein
MNATINAKGKLTIPRQVRRALGLSAGSRVVFEEQQPGAYVNKAAPKVSITVLKGMFGSAKTVLSIMEMNTIISRRGHA